MLNLVDESRSPTKTIFLLAWPVFIEQILTTLVNYADTAMVGSLGANATASVTISNAPVMMLNGIIMSLGIGITSLVARAVGAGEHEKVRKLIRHSLLALIFLGLPICALIIALHRVIPLWMGADPEILDTAANYNLITGVGRIFMTGSMMLNSGFRGYGDTRSPMIIHSIMNVINVILNFLLIYPIREISVFGSEFTMWGAGWGVEGAAVATAVGMMCAGFMNLGIAFFRKNEYRISLKDDWRPDRDLIRQVFKISIPAMLERLVMSSAGVLVSRSIASLGTISIASNSLALTAESMSYMPAFAFQTSTTTLVGQCLGADKPKLAEKFVNKSILISSIIMCFTGTFLFVFAAPIISFFTPDAAVIELAARCLKLTALIQVPQAIAWVYSGALRGAGDTKYNFYIGAITNLTIRTAMAVIAINVFHQGLLASITFTCIEILVRLVFIHLRYRSGKWKNAMSN